MSDLKNRLLLSALVAAALGGCSALPDVSLSDFGMMNKSDPLHSDDYNYFYRREQSAPAAVAASDLVGPDGRCAFSQASAPAYSPPPAAPAAGPEPTAQAPPASDPINPRSNQALYFTAGPEANSGAGLPKALPPQVRNGPSGIALQMTECQVVGVAGYTDRVEIGTNPRGQRTVTLAYMTGERPGIYRFIGGRLTSMERVEEPPQPKKPARKPAKTAKTKKAAPAQ